MKLYDEAFWLTLRNRRDRQAQFGRNLSELGNEPLHRIYGIDARGLAITTDLTANVMCLNDGYIGSYLSHLFLMKMIGAKPAGFRALVMEDDALLAENFHARLEQTMKAIPDDWDLVHLGGFKDNGLMQDGCWGYLITAEGAAKFERVLEQRRRHLDDTFKWARDTRQLRFYHTPNAIITEDVNGSDTRSPVERERGEIAREEPTKSYSQYGEDLFIEKFFDKAQTGNFLEIGALDGIKDSNCRRLALRGWSGVSIEANPHLFCRLNANYGQSPKVKTMCGLVYPLPGIRTFHLNNDGLGTTAADVFQDLHERVHYTGYCHLPAVTPDQLAALYGNNFDFVSLDAEGVDIEIAEASATLFANTRLLCIETDKPGKTFDSEYQKRWDVVLAMLGFTKVVHKTQGNTLLARE